MSLLQHVTPLDGIDRERIASAEEPSKTVRKQLSYDVFPLPVEQAQEQAVDVAYEVSTAKRIGKRRLYLNLLSLSMSFD